MRLRSCPPGARKPHIGEATVPDALNLAQAAEHLGLAGGTFAALVRAQIFPAPDSEDNRWHLATLDQTLEKLLRDGVPRSYRLPYIHEPPRRLVDETVRRHTGWRHGKKSKLINEPIGSPAFVQRWFALERAHAAEQTASTKRELIVEQSSPSSPPLAPRTAEPSFEVLAKRVISLAGGGPSKKKPKKLLSGSASVGSAGNVGKPLTSHLSAPYAADSRSHFGNLLTPVEVINRLRGTISPGTLRNWRSKPGADGPPWLKVGRAILYPEALLDHWLRDRLSSRIRD